MMNGRPADNSFKTLFHEKGAKALVRSLKNKIDISGKQSQTGQVNKEGKFHGKAIAWYDDGKIIVGSVLFGDWEDGATYEL